MIDQSVIKGAMCPEEYVALVELLKSLCDQISDIHHHACEVRTEVQDVIYGLAVIKARIQELQIVVLEKATEGMKK